MNNYTHIFKDIKQTALECGRDPSDIELVAVTKSVEWQYIQPLFDLGQRDFGENRIQEALEKKAIAPQGCRWHFIGSLQKNKVRKVIENFSLIHSVDSYELARKISECSQDLNLITHILLQSNTSGENSKHGYSPQMWKECFEALYVLPNISIDGLMTMAPLTEDVPCIENCFSSLRVLLEELNVLAKGKVQLRHLSMGMSYDYKIAIAEGATLLRIGSAIFQNKI
ncbi:MAG: YggS family pyridoxal phosphate-dependent enzyme [Parachlamydiaceae bacterium]|nr:YggS family pyridoxal phosphate-dependent enzyme [Parachlamydiaceae bacterium]